jgi:hypothetical protein
MHRALVLALVLAVPAAASPGERVRGNGQKTTEKRDVGPFDAISLRGRIDARVKVGPALSLTVTIDSNLQDHVLTRVKDRELVVEMSPRSDIDWRGDAYVEVTLPELRSFGTVGSGDAVIEGGKGDLALHTSGSGDIRWTGDANRLEVMTSGSGEVTLSGRAESLVARTSAPATCARATSACATPT